MQFLLKMVSLVQKLAAIEAEVDINFRKKIRKLNHQYNDISSYLKVGGDGKLMSVKMSPSNLRLTRRTANIGVHAVRDVLP